MKYKHLFWSVLILTVGFFAPQVFAQANDKYIWEASTPQTITGADDLKAKLESEVNKVLAAGHLAPFRALYGEGRDLGGQFFWYHAYDTVYTLSLAYPYLTAGTQNATVTYIKNEISAYPPWNAAYLSSTNGTKRQVDDLPAGIFSSELQNRYDDWGQYTFRPKLFAMYALWLYAQNTGDWTTIQNNWTSIKNFYTYSIASVSNRQEVTGNNTSNTPLYSGIAGAIGAARMAQHQNDTSFRDTVLADLPTAFTNGKNFSQVALYAENKYIYGSGESWNYTKAGSYMGFQFLDISPEIGRYMVDNASLKDAVLGTTPQNGYDIKSGERKYPLWYMSQAPFDTIYFGEGSGTAPDLKAMIFPIHAWVLKDSKDQLRKYLDVPDAPIGDYYYMQNLVRTIEAHGSECWKDVRNPTASCNTLGVSTVDRGLNILKIIGKFFNLIPKR